MRKLIGVAVLVVMVSMVGMAQETPKPEIYGGYQYDRTDGGGHGQGWNTAANLYVTRWLGGTADFSGVYNNGSIYTYTFGPVVSTHKQNFSPFAHALFGGARAASGSLSNNGMAMYFGGGVDYDGFAELSFPPGAIESRLYLSEEGRAEVDFRAEVGALAAAELAGVGNETKTFY